LTRQWARLPAIPIALPSLRGHIKKNWKKPGRLRIAYTNRTLAGEAVAADCVKALTDAVGLCSSLGHDLVEKSPQLDANFSLNLLTLFGLPVVPPRLKEYPM